METGHKGPVVGGTWLFLELKSGHCRQSIARVWESILGWSSMAPPCLISLTLSERREGHIIFMPKVQTQSKPNLSIHPFTQDMPFAHHTHKHLSVSVFPMCKLHEIRVMSPLTIRYLSPVPST